MAYKDYAKKAGLTYKGALTKRSKTVLMVLHHAASNATVTSVHNDHKGRGSKGIHYNIYIHKDGTVYDERGIEYVGGGVKNSSNNLNSTGLHICCQGNFDVEHMGAAQKAALTKVIKDCLELYPGIKKIYGHKELKAIYPEQTATACPGKYYPLEEMKQLLNKKPSPGGGNILNGWHKDAKGWSYYQGGDKVKGWDELEWSGGTNWFWFNDEGYMITGWKQIGDIWYYLDPANGGAMATGWHKIMYVGNIEWFYFFGNGRMAQNEFVNDNKKWYYMNSKGVMLANTSLRINSNGAIEL